MALLLEQKGVDLSKARVMAGKLRKKNKRICFTGGSADLGVKRSV